MARIQDKIHRNTFAAGAQDAPPDFLSAGGLVLAQTRPLGASIFNVLGV
jgi:hypothetical protein